MFKPVDAAPAGARRRRVAAALACLVPLGALAGITGGSSNEAARAPGAASASSGDKAARAPSGTYQIRCWQDGRLLFEENQVSLPVDGARYGVKMAGTDRNGKPIYVADTRNATCLIRAADRQRAWPR
jgi:hypothetical protein